MIYILDVNQKLFTTIAKYLLQFTNLISRVVHCYFNYGFNISFATYIKLYITSKEIIDFNNFLFYNTSIKTLIWNAYKKRIICTVMEIIKLLYKTFQRIYSTYYNLKFYLQFYVSYNKKNLKRVKTCKYKIYVCYATHIHKKYMVHKIINRSLL